VAGWLAGYAYYTKRFDSLFFFLVKVSEKKNIYFLLGINILGEVHMLSSQFTNYDNNLD
jgi:hypothetical protein